MTRHTLRAEMFTVCNERAEPIGRAEFDYQLNGDVIFAYYIERSSRGRGYGTELVRAMAKHAKTGGCKRCLAYVHEANAASCRVLERNGFGRVAADDRCLPTDLKYQLDL